MQWVSDLRSRGVQVLEHQVVKRGPLFQEQLRAEVLRLGPPVMLVPAEAAKAGSLEGARIDKLAPAMAEGDRIGKEDDVVVVRVPVAGAHRVEADGVVAFELGTWRAAGGVSAVAAGVSGKVAGTRGAR